MIGTSASASSSHLMTVHASAVPDIIPRNICIHINPQILAVHLLHIAHRNMLATNHLAKHPLISINRFLYQSNIPDLLFRTTATLSPFMPFRMASRRACTHSSHNPVTAKGIPLASTTSGTSPPTTFTIPSMMMMDVRSLNGHVHVASELNHAVNSPTAMASPSVMNVSIHNHTPPFF